MTDSSNCARLSVTGGVSDGGEGVCVVCLFVLADAPHAAARLQNGSRGAGACRSPHFAEGLRKLRPLAKLVAHPTLRGYV